MILPNKFVLLRLFGIHDSATYWGRVLPHHPNVVVWGPEYQHPCWHNEGNRDSMMPTITERWAPANTDSTMITMRNRDKNRHELRLNEVRITFMKNLVDTGYVFLGVYRLSKEKSDSTQCVFLFNGFDNPTAIAQPSAEQDVPSSEVLDLQGRRIARPSKGLYVVRSLQGKNGKKVIVK